MSKYPTTKERGQMMFSKATKINISMICLMVVLNTPAIGAEYQTAWDNPTANMTSGSSKPGYAQLSWTTGSVLPVKLRNGMVTMVTLPNGEQIADAVVGNNELFNIDANQGDRTLFISPTASNQGNDTNL